MNGSTVATPNLKVLVVDKYMKQRHLTLPTCTKEKGRLNKIVKRKVFSSECFDLFT